MSPIPIQSRSRSTHLQVLSLVSGADLEILCQLVHTCAPALSLRPCTPARPTIHNFLACAGLPEIKITYTDFGQAVHAEGPSPFGTGFVLFEQESLLTLDGESRSFAPLEAYFAAPDQPLSVTIPIHTPHYAVLLQGQNGAEQQEVERLFRHARQAPTRELRRKMGEQVHEHLARIKYAPSHTDIEKRLDSLRQVLLRLLSRHAAGMALPDMDRPAVDPRLKRVSDFIEQQHRWNYDPETLCDLAGMSLRNLYYGFERAFGTTPFRFHRNCKLARVRIALLNDMQQQHPIAWHATNEGFYHLSRFASQYRKLFGELPSATTHWLQSLLVKRDPTACGSPNYPLSQCTPEDCQLWHWCQKEDHNAA